MDDEIWTRAAALAVEQPPRCFGELSLTVIEPDPQERPSLFVTFGVACKSCYGKIFQILGYPTVAPDPSPYFGVPPDDVLFRPPHRLRCKECNATSHLFDPRTDGYDGILGHGSSYEVGEDGEQPVVSAGALFEVRILLGYSIEYKEYIEIAEEAKILPSDLFDWIDIQGKSANEYSDFSAGYECA